MSRIRTYVVGREDECDVRLDDSSVSSRHAEVVRLTDGRLYVTDLASRNGTFVVEDRGPREIQQDFLPTTGRIRFGNCTLKASELEEACRRERYTVWWGRRRGVQPTGRGASG